MDSKSPVKGPNIINHLKCQQCSRTFTSVFGLNGHKQIHKRAKARYIAKRKNKGAKKNRPMITRKALVKNESDTVIRYKLAEKTAEELNTNAANENSGQEKTSSDPPHPTAHVDENKNGATTSTEATIKTSDMYEIEVPRCSLCKIQLHYPRKMVLHFKSEHIRNKICMYFPNGSDFKAWREQTEQQTKTTFTILNKYKGKHHYRCDAKMVCKDTKTSLICPASMEVNAYANGVQVVFYPTHHGHEFVEYKPSKQVRRFIVPQKKKNKAGFSDEKRLLLKDFKYVMNFILRNVQNLDEVNLTDMYGVAIDMQTMLQRILTKIEPNARFARDERSHVMKRKANDSMSIADDVRTSRRIKERKLGKSIVDANDSMVDVKSDEKEKVIEVSTPKIVNTYTLTNFSDQESDSLANISADDTTETSEVPEDSKDEIKKEDAKNDSANTSPSITQNATNPSFNDSYKSFIEQTIGKKIHNNANNELPTKSPKLFYNKSNGVDVSSLENGEDDDPLLKPKRLSKKKERVKTKLGQFSPRKFGVAKLSKSLSPVGKPKIIDYEVMERDNECNILILKI